MSEHRLYLVRHGETDWNLAGRLQGGRDIPLNDLGREQAVEAARVIERLAPDVRALSYISSPLMRATETMELLRAELKLRPGEFARDPRLMEISFGKWEGATWPELRRRDPANLAVRETDPWNFVPPGGENYVTLGNRVLNAIGTLDRDAVVVTHGGVIRALLHTRAGMPTDIAAHLPVRQGAVYALHRGGFELAA